MLVIVDMETPIMTRWNDGIVRSTSPDPTVFGITADDDRIPPCPNRWPLNAFRLGQTFAELTATCEAYVLDPNNRNLYRSLHSSLLGIQGLRRGLRTAISDSAYRVFREELYRLIVDAYNIDERVSASPSTDPHRSAEEIPALVASLTKGFTNLRIILRNCISERHLLAPFYHLGEVFRRAVCHLSETPASSNRRSINRQVQASLEELAQIAGAVPELIRRRCATIERLAQAEASTQTQAMSNLASLIDDGITGLREPDQFNPGAILDVVVSRIVLELSLISLSRSEWPQLGYGQPSDEPPGIEHPDSEQEAESHESSGPIRDPAVERRDRFIYEQACEGVPYCRIQSQVRERAVEEGWTSIGSEEGVRQAAIRYAKRHNLDRPPPRQRFGHPNDRSTGPER